MKKARIVLSAVALLAVIGGAVAFKAARYTPQGQYYTTTLEYSTFGTLYTAAVPFVGPAIGGFISTTGLATVAVLRPTTATSTTAKITLTEDGGSATITIPAWSSIALSTYTTNVQ